ncbi:MIR motif-containing protein [Sporodiniella umbellata]|nr:MIR motif-containing protein [Sporodiniella umbellata]
MADEDYTGFPPEGNIVHIGNTISLKHNMTGRFLASEEGVSYEEGSFQQKVFAREWIPSPPTQFIVIPRVGEERDMGEDVNFGEVIRLKHVGTRSNLHTHPDITSPVTGQQEVSCYGDDSLTDENDEWVVEQWPFGDEENEEFDPEDKTWYVGRSFYLKHVATGVTLHSHEEPISEDSNEVCGYGSGPDENDRWRVIVDLPMY